MANVKSGIVAKKNNEPATINAYVKLMEGEIRKALPSVITPERFTRMVVTALSANKALQRCTPQSFLGAMMQAAQLGVEPNTPLGQAYLIPYGSQCQFQLGYKGLLDLAYRSGQVTIVDAQVVKENDLFEYELGLEPKLKHVPAKSNRGEPVYYYAMFRTKDGGYGFQVMSYEDIVAFAKLKSKTYGNGPWKTDFDEMAKKTVLKKALKYAPLKSDFVKAIATDETIKSTVAPDMVDIESEDAIDVETVDAAEAQPEKEAAAEVQQGNMNE